MKKQRLLIILMAAIAVAGFACTTRPAENSNVVSTASPSPSPSASQTTPSTASGVTLPVLNAFFAQGSFKTELKSKLGLTDAQIESLQKSANDEIARLRQSNAEQEEGNAAEAREHATTVIRNAIGDQKATELQALVNERWLKGEEEPASEGAKPNEISMLPGPNAVPTDSRIVVNIPAFRMDVFRDGNLVKSYKIGIGYPQFPLPTGLRKAQQIIFNPTWTPPDEPWVASMKNITVGEKVEAGSNLNPLGPVKIPIGLPSLIHGGKSPAKIGTFASHGCVGLTTPQAIDFAKVLASTAGGDISNKAIDTYLKDKTKTKVVKLQKVVPVELRYETIVVEDGELHIYKDVYDENTNTEENLRHALEVNGSRFEDLTQEERDQVLEALNSMSAHPKKQVASKESNTNLKSNVNTAARADNKKNQSLKKPARNQKEVVIEIAALSGKGYPAPVALDTGTGKPATKTVPSSASRD